MVETSVKPPGSPKQKAAAIVAVSRAPFLLLPVVLTALGAAASAYETTFIWPRTIVAGLGLVALHIAVNALNEASDMASGIDRHTTPTPFSGGSGTLPAGQLAITFVRRYALTMAAVGFLVGLGFLAVIGWPLVPVLLLGALAIFGYSGLFHRFGLGEIFAGLGLGGLSVVGISLIQDGQFGSATIVASLIATLLTFNLLLLNEFPDAEADARGGRRHLVILCGRRGAAVVYFLAVGGVLLLPFFAVLDDIFPPLALIGLLPGVVLIPVVRWAPLARRQPVPVRALAANVM